MEPRPHTTVLRAPMQATVHAVRVGEGDQVHAGQTVVVLESMKMEHHVELEHDAEVVEVLVEPGQTVERGAPLVVVAHVDLLERDDAAGEDQATGNEAESPVGQTVRADLAEVIDRHERGHDDRRSDAVAKRRRHGRRTARENIADLVDPGSFVEYGPLAVAAQRRRRSIDDLIDNTPADGLVGGVATVDGRSVVVASYDYTVLAGTQGYQNHRKKDRLFELAEQHRLPVVLFAEGGGGRPGDVDAPGVSGLDVMAFHLFARLAGKVPLVGVVSGRCFAGNAALAGCCDVIIATDGANLGMGGPAMIEGGGLGTFSPEQIGPLDVQVANGVVDIAVADDVEAVLAARRCLSYLTGATQPQRPADEPLPTCADQALLRHVVPEQRTRVYPIRRVLELLADTDSVLELRSGFAAGMVTAFARIDGHPIGVIANDPGHLGGAIDTDAAQKAADFLERCDAHGLAVLSLCDTPGFMVGPDEEAKGLVRTAARLFTVGASLRVPIMTVIVRKAYGLGAQAMAGGSLKVPVFCVAWPTGEVGGMGLEGAVRLGFRKELEAVDDPDEREALFASMVQAAYEHGKGLNAASHFELDDVIDPADTRRWIAAALGASTGVPPRSDVPPRAR